MLPAIHQHINVLNSHRTIEPELIPIDWILDFHLGVRRTLKIERLGVPPPFSGVRGTSSRQSSHLQRLSVVEVDTSSATIESPSKFLLLPTEIELN